MDQDAFRKLLAQPRKPGAAAPTTNSRPSLIKKVDASQPIFAPRTAKAAKPAKAGASSSSSKRAGLGFKKSDDAAGSSSRVFNDDDDANAPVKGLDFAALEAAKAQAAAAAEELDDVLEETYKKTGAAAATPEPPASTTTTGKKRTREELIQELKAKRQKTDGADPVDEARKLEDAKKQGKFRPIGAPAHKEGKIKKKKKVEKAKAAPAVAPAPVAEASKPEPQVQVVPERAAGKQRAPEPEPEPEEDMGDMDLFDGVEEYKGLDEDDDENDASPPPRAASPAAGARQAKWFDLDDGLGTLPAAPARPPTPPPAEAQETRRAREESPDEDVRLAPLASSSFSIKDVLAMDQELEKEDKRKARKEKKKKEGGGEKTKLSGEAKANRDLQKLESYTSKKRG